MESGHRRSPGGPPGMTTRLLNGVRRHLRRAALPRDGGTLSDGQLLDRFLAARDGAAFEALQRRHGPMVLGLCRRGLRQDADAEDAFQATSRGLGRKRAWVAARVPGCSW